MDETFQLDLAERLAAAVGLGLLMGLERERAQRADEVSFGGVRTFPLIALTGAAAAYAATVMQLPSLALMVFAAIGALVVVSYLAASRQGEIGITTEVSGLLSFVLGVLCLHGNVAVATAIAVIAVLLLALKDTLHALANRIEARDVEAALRFALITAIVLPLLPDRSYGPPPFDVLNPYRIWLMVVLIAGLDLAGYILVKVLGPEHGIGVTGLLGGLVSSTALTLGFAQRSKAHPAQSRALALGILLAWTVMFVRVVAEVAAVNRALVPRVASAVGALTLAGLVAIGLLHRGRHLAPATASVATPKNPLELRVAIRFAFLFAAITLGARVAEVYFGDAGLYAAGALAGLSDVDAITLAMANLAARSPEHVAVATHTIVIAALSNTGAKCGLVFALGSGPLRRAMAPIAAGLAAAGLVGMWLAL